MITFFSIVTFAIYLSVISLILAFASVKGLTRLWIVAGCLTFITFVGGLTIETLPLYSIHCGPLCGFGVDVSLIAISVAIIVGATIHSIPWLRMRAWLRILSAALFMGLVMGMGIGTWIS